MSKTKERPLYWSCETKDGPKWLTDYELFGGKSTPASRNHIPLKDLAQFLDDEAEGANQHDLVGIHTWLAETIADISSTDVARRVMLAIVDRGGLIR